ncbi:ABC transporter ATP-binding protein [Variovorax sp. J22R133]|uniref:ABC transporter ATP-binding protein n=1 Tax=Variovorax brevis TaxID=3053503 RepID=UPI002576D455|nr:ABC transporter ATP-binding protein [Variovorax sp. J22R133]MDM0114078.1 ABC transporter ATP-binding protein [Variovorax sp. J22R133]
MSSTPVLQLHDLVKRYGGLTVTNKLNLSLVQGQIHAIIGPNGAGKTTLIQLISGALKPDSGRIVFNGRDVTACAMHERVAMGLARSYQITNVFKTCSVLDNLALSVQARSGSSLRFWQPALSESALFREAAAIGERVGLSARLQAIAGSLSHGEQRKLEMGLALASSPQLLLLDEPMAGMGPEESAQLIPLIKELGSTLTVVLIEHDMDAVFQLADRISVLVSGQVMATGLPEQIRGNAEVRKAYLGDEVAT